MRVCGRLLPSGLKLISDADRITVLRARRVGHPDARPVRAAAPVRGDPAQFFATAPPIPGARSTLRRLSDEGYRIRIITHRLFIHFFHQEAVSQTIEWLDRHGIPYSDLCFMKEKDQVGADIYVDDAPENIERLRARGHYAICFGNSTNGQIALPRATNWDEVYRLIKQRCPSSRATYT